MPNILVNEDDLTALLLALAAIASDSADGEAIKVAMVALYETETGRQFLHTNPIEVQ